jgi:hypothetical protein
MSVGTNETRLGFVSLFASLGTLVCCALPSLLVLLGLGATVATVLSVAPWLVAVSRHKEWVFAVSGILIAANFCYVYRLAPRIQARALACSPDDPRACAAASRFSRVALWLSAGLWSAGFFTAFVLGPLLMRFSE